VERPIPYNRNACLAATINKNKADDRLALELRNKFEQDAVLLRGTGPLPDKSTMSLSEAKESETL
jgi:hypothetical protein